MSFQLFSVAFPFISFQFNTLIISETERKTVDATLFIQGWQAQCYTWTKSGRGVVDKLFADAIVFQTIFFHFLRVINVPTVDD